MPLNNSNDDKYRSMVRVFKHRFVLQQQIIISHSIVSKTVFLMYVLLTVIVRPCFVLDGFGSSFDCTCEKSQHSLHVGGGVYLGGKICAYACIGMSQNE